MEHKNFCYLNYIFKRPVSFLEQKCWSIQGMRRKKAIQFSFEIYEEKFHPVKLRGSAGAEIPGKERKSHHYVQFLSYYPSLTPETAQQQ